MSQIKPNKMFVINSLQKMPLPKMKTAKKKALKSFNFSAFDIV
jgi:hypothetical protein